MNARKLAEEARKLLKKGQRLDIEYVIDLTGLNREMADMLIAQADLLLAAKQLIWYEVMPLSSEERKRWLRAYDKLQEDGE